MAGKFDNIFNTQVSTTPVSGKFSNIFSENIVPKTSIPETPKVVSLYPGTLQTLSELQIDPLSLKSNPTKALNSAWDSIKGTISQEAQNIKELFTSLTPGKRIAESPESVGILLKTTAGAASVVFSPITSLFEGANQIPILGSISRLVSLPFEAVGETGVNIANKVVDKLPIPNEAKEQIKPGMEEIFALAGQLALGKLTQIGDKKIGELTKKYGVKDTQTIVKKSMELANDKIIVPEKIATDKFKNIFEEKQIENINQNIKYYKETGGETIGKKTENAPLRDLYNDLQTNEGKKIAQEEVQNAITKGELKPQEDGSIKLYRVGETSTRNKLISATYDKEVADNFSKTASVSGKELPIYEFSAKPEEIAYHIGGGEKEVLLEKPIIDSKLTEFKEPTKISGVAKSIEAKAIEQGLTKGFSELAEYTPVVIKEQARIISDLMLSDLEKAKRIATGKEELPKEIKGASLIKAMEDYAMETKDGELALELAKSPLVSETSEAGQTLRLTRERTPDSATAKIKEVISEREKSAERKLKGKTSSGIKNDFKNNIKEKIIKSRPTKYDWNNFIDSIKC